MASDKSKPGRKSLSGGVADAVVMVAMALVTLALCVGLVLQSGLGFWLSATVSVSFYIGLLTLHTIVRRTGQIETLSGEVERLRGEIARMGGAPAAADAAQSGARSAARTSAADAAAPTVAKREAPPAAAALPPVGAPPAPVIAATATATATATPQAATPSQSSPPSAPLSQPPQQAMGPDFSARMQKAMRGQQSPPPPPPKQQRPAPHGFAAITSSRPVRSPATHGAQFEREQEYVPQAPPHAHDAGTHDPDPRSITAQQASPPPMAGNLADTPQEADVAMINGLIRKLAAEVDAAEIEKLGPPASPVDASPAVDDDREFDKARAIEASVGALKRTAQSMKAPAAASALGGLANPDDVDTQPIGFRRSHERAATPAPAAPPAPASEPEYDLDKLMQRAQSITQPALPTATTATATEPEYDLDTLLRRAAPIAAPIAADNGAPPPLTAATAAAIEAALDHAAFEADTRDERAEIDLDAMTATSAAATDQAAAEPAPPALPDPRLARVAAAIEAGRVEVFLEPILDLARQQPSHFEVTVCLRDADGAEITGAEDGRSGSVLPLLDSVRLARTAQVARLLDERRKPGSVFSTFSGQSLESDEFLGTFADSYDSHARLAQQLVLTFAQADVRRFRAPQWGMLAEMRELGFRFALRAVTDLDMDFEPLSRAGFAFAKLDADVFLDGLAIPGSILPAADICSYLEEQGLILVVEHIDDESKRARVAASGVQLGQGQLFGGPRLMKASALAAASHSAAA